MQVKIPEKIVMTATKLQRSVMKAWEARPQSDPALKTLRFVPAIFIGDCSPRLKGFRMVLQSPIRFRLLVLGLALSATIVAAQPTPVGPPPNGTDAKGKVDVSFLTLMVRNIAQMAVDSANAKLQKEGKSSRASIESLDVWGPYRLQGETLNKPNSWYVLVPYLLTIKVSIPITSDRHIGIPIDLNIFCDNWHTKSGTVTVRAQLGPASIEGGNIL